MTTSEIRFSRVWAITSADTFDIPPIAGFVQKYLLKSKVSIDPFARNKRWATYTNDLNPDTAAEHHMKALDFLKMLRDNQVKSDLVIFDPPYSLEQAKRVYDSFGRFSYYDSQNAIRWTDEMDVVRDLLKPNGVFLKFGWNTSGMGNKHECDIEEILIVCHGPAHYDTICMAERRRVPQPTLFDRDDMWDNPEKYLPRHSEFHTVSGCPVCESLATKQ